MIRASCEVLTARRAGVYHSLTLVAPDIAEAARPGQFVEIGMPPGRETLLRRPFSIHQASRRGGYAGTVEIVFDVTGPGTAWLAEAQAHDVVDVIGPLGRAFALPKEQTSCLLVGGGYGAAPLYFLAEELRIRRNGVGIVVGARSAARVFKPIEGKRLADAVWVTTEDGSTGDSGRVTDVLPDALRKTEARVVYACGPNPMLRAVSDVCAAAGVPCQIAVEEMMACGLGLCWTCTVPMIAPDGGGWWNVRACAEGPVFNGARIWWDKWLGPAEPSTVGDGDSVDEEIGEPAAEAAEVPQR
jgi:dihydroorotate dehydrogenase electron transfer subunit